MGDLASYQDHEEVLVHLAPWVLEVHWEVHLVSLEMMDKVDHPCLEHEEGLVRLDPLVLVVQLVVPEDQVVEDVV